MMQFAILREAFGFQNSLNTLINIGTRSTNTNKLTHEQMLLTPSFAGQRITQKVLFQGNI